MDDEDVLERIAELVKGEHELEDRHGAEGLSEQEQARSAATEVALDRCWDLLRQRRARRASGQDPDGAGVRSERVVEGYQQEVAVCPAGRRGHGRVDGSAHASARARGHTMKLLVVGGAGYIGSVVAAQLVATGHDVTVADDLCRGHRDAVPEEAAFAEVDLLDGPAVTALVAQGFDGVLHFAALSLVGESVAEPVRYFRTNVAGSLNLLDAMRAAGVRRLVFSSTAAVYGEPDEVPITEGAPTVPTNPYGASKLAVDHAIRYECEASGLGAASLRYFNVAGASGRWGERHDPETHLIPLVLQAAAGTRPSVSIFGDDYPTPDGTAVRDYIHVEDLARAHLLALDALSSPGHRVFNLGNGAGFSVREVVEAARAVTGREIPTVEAPRRSGDPAVLVASSARIRSELGWSPQKPDLKDMVADAWEHLQRSSG